MRSISQSVRGVVALKARLALVVVALLAVSLAAVVGPAQAGIPGAAPDSPVNPDTLSIEPTPGGGVEGFVQPSVTQNWRVHAFAQAGDRIFVGGSFTTVSALPTAGAATYPQPFLAAYDLVTNEFIDTWRPTFDDAVWALEVHDGKLIVGGEFNTVNGTAREGLVALDPITGATDPTFQASIANVGTNFEGSVRDLEVVGNQIYVVGDYNRLVDDQFAHGRFRTARIDATTGRLDSSWDPRPSGGGVFDVSVDTSRGQVILTGTFTSVNASANTRTAAIVSSGNGATVPGYPISLNGNWSRSYVSTVVGDQYWIAGEQHYLQFRDADTWAFEGCVATGFGTVFADCTSGSWRGGAGAGGDFQVGEMLGPDVLLYGCHCRGSYYNSVTGDRTDLDDRGGVRVYRANGSEWDWLPNLRFWNEGPYAAFADTRGCVYIGGDFTGNVDGFGRFCNEGDDPDAGLPPFGTPDNVVLETNLVDSVTVTWDRVADAKGYLIHRDFQFVQWLPSNASTWTDIGLTEGEEYRYQVRAQRPDNTYSAPSPVQSILVGEDPDDELPPFGTPANVVLDTNGVDEVSVTWDRVADAKGYLIHRDFQFVQWLPATASTWTDDTVVQGEAYRYQVRAQRPDNTYSAPSPVQSILVSNAGPDVTPPDTPPNAAAVLNAAGDEATVTWDAAADDVGVIGYLIHRDWQFVTFLPAGQLSFVDAGLQPGTRYRYQVRAQDAAGNNSAPTGLLIVETP